MVGNTDSLSTDNVVGLAARALRPEASPEFSLQTPYEAVALIGHATLLAVGFRLVGLGEDHTIDSSSENPSLPAEWNASSTSSFRYAHSQSSMQYLLKVSRLGNNAVVFALALGDDRTTSFDVPVRDYISQSALPLSSDADLETTLREVFISGSRLSDLISLFKINVIQKLAPGLYKEGQETSTQAQDRQPQPERAPRHDPLRDDTQPPPARPYPFDDPLAIPPRRPGPPGDFPPPGFEDEFEIQRPPRRFPGGGRHPLNIGESDLYPAGLGPNDPFRGMGPGLGGPPGGMHPTFDDPLFGGRRGGGYDPSAPPGARYDPVGPGQGPPFGRGRGGPGGFGGGFGGFGGDII
ncbi:PI31 proteasome regulator N-terminal-domain-containing protein [Aspergillus karnatakaensis]|uniref:proteasome inhibitor PI31 family protein n=1 Tax=Aspergillus karnatakaensis TaxID=1810916 RepID=UPI003CCE4EA6